MFSCPSFHYTCPRTSFSTQGSYQVWCYYICINATFGNHSFLELYLLYCIDFCTTILVPSMFIMNNYLQTKICNHTFCHRGKSFQARVLKRMVEVGFLDIETALLVVKQGLHLHVSVSEYADGLLHLSPLPKDVS